MGGDLQYLKAFLKLCFGGGGKRGQKSAKEEPHYQKCEEGPELFAFRRTSSGNPRSCLVILYSVNLLPCSVYTHIKRNSFLLYSACKQMRSMSSSLPPYSFTRNMNQYIISPGVAKGENSKSENDSGNKLR